MLFLKSELCPPSETHISHTERVNHPRRFPYFLLARPYSPNISVWFSIGANRSGC
jgi:hypothetical protein